MLSTPALMCLWCGTYVDPLDDAGYRPDPDNSGVTVCPVCADPDGPPSP